VLEAQVLDCEGKVLQSSDPIRFTMRTTADGPAR
jgi:hypothetical protein